MSAKEKNLSSYQSESVPDGGKFRIGIVVSAWNDSITQNLLDGCINTLRSHGVPEKQIFTAFVPGSFELPVGARLMLNRHKLDAIIGLGCVIKGETNHDEYINHAVAKGFTDLSLYTGTPCIFGVLTTTTMEQAVDRAGGKYGNKGTECAVTALKMAEFSSQLAGADSLIGFKK